MSDASRDKRLRAKYGISLEDYNRILSEQGGGCAGCGGQGKTRSLHVDHDHKWKYVKLNTHNFDGLTWISRCQYLRGSYVGVGKRKNLAVQSIRQKLKRASVRGILCFGCNGAIRKMRDRPDIASNLAAYLGKHQGVDPATHPEGLK